jgi:transposase, IS30 family
VTLVERSTRYVMLGHLSGGHTAEEVRDVLVPLIQTLPEHLRGSLTWDQGCEMAAHKQISVATGVPVYSATRTRHGSAVRTRTPTACFGSTSPRAPTCAFTALRTSSTSPSNSTADHAKRSAGELQPSVCVIY